MDSAIGSDRAVRLLTKNELASRLSISKSMVDKLMSQGLPRYQIGRSVRFDIEQVLKSFSKFSEVVKDGPDVRDVAVVNSSFESGNSEKSPLVREVVKKWMATVFENLKTNTQLQYRRCIEFIEPLYDRPIETIKPSDIDNLIGLWKLNNIKSHQRTSFVKEYDVIKLVFNWYQNNYDNAKLTLPFKDRHNKLIVVKQKQKPMRRFMTEDETRAFLMALREEGELYFAIGAVQIIQLMRISEVLAMKWSNLDIKNKQYHLCEHVVWERVGGIKPRLEPGTKTIRAGEVYTLNLFQEAISIMEHLGRHKRSDLIFSDGGELLTYRQIQYRYDNAFKRAGLNFSGTHCMRRTGATIFYNLSGDLLALQSMGSWADARTPQIYAKVTAMRAKESIKLIESNGMKILN